MGFDNESIFTLSENDEKSAMIKFIKVHVSKQMEIDYNECADLEECGDTKDCETCSCNGGSLGCLGEYTWWDDSQN